MLLARIVEVYAAASGRNDASHFKSSTPRGEPRLSLCDSSHPLLFLCASISFTSSFTHTYATHAMSISATADHDSVQLYS